MRCLPGCELARPDRAERAARPGKNGPRAGPWAAPSARSMVVARPGWPVARPGPIGLRAVPARPVVHL